jgi:hypothetical protein
MRHDLASTIDRIHALLARIERGDYPDQDRLEDTLTDGYAWALSLDAECDRLERRLSDHAAGLSADSSMEEARELTALARLLARRRRDLEALRDLLAVLKAGVQEARVA